MDITVRNVLVLGLLLGSTCCLAARPSSCERPDALPEQSWNPGASAVTTGLRRFYELDRALDSALAANDMTSIDTLATEYLAAAAEYRCNWNYGNAVHDANSALGIVALSKGDRALAAKYLLEAAKSPGSPQLDSFGPKLALAELLVAAGERDAVIAYLEGIHRFWRMDNGKTRTWIAELQAGKTPTFSMQLP